MIVEIKVPDLGESINEVEIGEWLVEVGDWVNVDDDLVAVDSDKATVEIPSPQAGVLVEIIKKQGEPAAIGEVVGRLDTEKEEAESDGGGAGEKTESEAPAGKSKERVAKTTTRASEDTDTATTEAEETEELADNNMVMPAAARILGELGIDADGVEGTGPGGRVLKEDALKAVEKSKAPQEKKEQPPSAKTPQGNDGQEEEERVAMTPIRRTIASRLLEAKQNMALLTTFNEADMSEVKRFRSQFGKDFNEKYGIRLGFMSFFIKASVAALLDFPVVNARIEGNEIVYRRSCDIGVAIGGGKGLVVPVLRRAETMSFAGIEQQIGDFAERAQANKLSMDELSGGSFTISNGGVYGSLLSTPIVNPPQSAILGLHAIQDRPVAIDGEVVIRPMMYLALTYDHRIIDGREAVTFLRGIKERIENPQKLLLEI